MKEYKILEIKAQKFYDAKQNQKETKLISWVWNEFKILGLQNKATNFRYFILQKTTLKGFSKNIEIQKQLKIKESQNQEKINLWVKKRYFIYLKEYMKLKKKHYEMAAYWYNHKIKKNILKIFIRNARRQPVTKAKLAEGFYYKSLITRGFKGFQFNLEIQTQKYLKKLQEQKEEMADIK